MVGAWPGCKPLLLNLGRRRPLLSYRTVGGLVGFVCCQPALSLTFRPVVRPLPPGLECPFLLEQSGRKPRWQERRCIQLAPASAEWLLVECKPTRHPCTFSCRLNWTRFAAAFAQVAAIVLQSRPQDFLGCHCPFPERNQNRIPLVRVPLGHCL